MKIDLSSGISLALLALALSAGTPSVAAPSANGTVIAKIAYAFPKYESVEGMDFYAEKSEYDAAVGDPKFTFEKLQTVSDGLSVVTYLYRPSESANRKLPVIIFSRGSATMGDAAPQLIAFFHRLASQGFVVVAPQYRGSDGGEGKDEIGGADLDDVTSALQLAKSLDYADTRNVFLYGESRGGMMTYQAVRDGLPVNAAAVFGAFTDLEIMNQSPYVQKVIPQIWPDYAQNKDAIIRRRSAKYWPEKLSVPLLIMNGTADQQVDPKQPLALAIQLQELHKDYALILYNNGNHLLTADRLDRDAQAIAWFRKHLRN
jgi:dipeptidyl aminopeptidase/acylaminoacyl peptidase